MRQAALAEQPVAQKVQQRPAGPGVTHISTSRRWLDGIMINRGRGDRDGCHQAANVIGVVQRGQQMTHRGLARLGATERTEKGPRSNVRQPSSALWRSI